MRVVYQSFGPSSNAAYCEALRLILARIGASHGATVNLATIEETRFASKQVRAFHPLAVARLVGDAYRASSSGVSAFVIGNIQDPGLYECRQVCECPVVGMLESTIAGVQPFAARIGLVTTSRLVVPLLSERIRLYGADHAVACIQTTGGELTGWAQAFTDPDVRTALVARLLSAAERAVESGAEIVVPASGLMSALLCQAWGIASGWSEPLDGTPIANPIAFSIAAAASSAQLARSGVIVARGGTYNSPDRDELDALFGNQAPVEDEQ